MTQTEHERTNGRLAAAHADLGFALATLARQGCKIAAFGADAITGPRIFLAAPPRRPPPGAEQIGEHRSALYGGAPAETWRGVVGGVVVTWEVKK